MTATGDSGCAFVRFVTVTSNVAMGVGGGGIAGAPSKFSVSHAATTKANEPTARQRVMLGKLIDMALSLSDGQRDAHHWVEPAVNAAVQITGAARCVAVAEAAAMDVHVGVRIGDRCARAARTR